MFNKYYQDELTYLRQLGQEFAHAHPQIGHMLAETGTDPDVERLLEGFAFLTGRIRQRLDSELPELTHAFVGLLWPHYLRPIPAMSVVQFRPTATLQDLQTIPRGTDLDSVPVDGTRCRFRTTSDVLLYPFSLDATNLDVPLSKPSTLTLGFAVSEKANLAKLNLGALRLYLHGEPAIAFGLYLWLCRHTRAVTYRVGDRQVRLDRDALSAGGFSDKDALLPYPTDAFPGYRLLQEYFSLPEKFLFIDLHDLSPLARMDAGGRFDIIIEFDQRPPDTLRVTPGSVRIGCTPIVNLQSIRSSPIRVDFEKTEYRLRADSPNPDHYEVFSVDRVLGWLRGTVREHEYLPFFSYQHTSAAGNEKREYYQLRLRPATVGHGTETYLSFVTAEETGIMPSTETVAADLTCSNRHLGEKLRPGDISVATSQSPAFAAFENIARVTTSVSPPLEGRLLWRLIAHQSLNYLSLTNLESLRGLLGLYNFHALVDRQAARANELRLSGITAINAHPDEILRHGSTYRGVSIALDLNEDQFAGEGDMYLFASVLNNFLNLYVTMNAFTRLRVAGTQQGGIYEWPPMLGQHALL
ncbi:MAG: type VI secretion system baseplate subunit TssF [candidate division Zixibacteria bacterium]|nr:type VI secretion system baseplate subunit TssF [candidate division Zixibacteria bacterium]